MGRGQGRNEDSTGTSVVHHRSRPDHHNAIDVLTHVGSDLLGLVGCAKQDYNRRNHRRRNSFPAAQMG
jgi:hypothetical protein